eukprot:m.86634 g.86634  ORF g.86634 m.86634 type:complete len:519 (-) comp21348_c0_seq2:119-1675(-)
MVWVLLLVVGIVPVLCGTPVEVSLGTQTPLTQVSEGFLSFTTDWWDPILMNKSHRPDYPHDGCPPFSHISEFRNWYDANVFQMPWNDPHLRYLAKQLRPSYLRLGGSAADFVVYNVSRPGEPLPKCDWLCLNMSTFDAMADFAADVGAGLVFAVADLYGVNRSAKIEWNINNTEALLDHIVANDISIDSFEVGNEGTSCFSYTSSNDAISRFTRFNALLEQKYPDPKHRPFIAGPDIDCHAADYIGNFMNGTQSFLDAVTYHYYGCNGNVLDLLKPEQLSSPIPAIQSLIGNISEYQRRGSIKQGLWAGETGPHGSSGVKGFTDRFLSGFWYLDSLGLAASLGVQRHFRQTFSGGFYEMVHHTTPPNAQGIKFSPNPDYYTSVLHKRLVGSTVLQVNKQTEADDLRVYAHCSVNDSSSVVLLVINLSNNMTFDLTISAQHQQPLQPAEEQKLSSHQVYWLSAPALNSSIVSLNDRALQLQPDGSLPALQGLTKTGQVITVGPLTYGFVVLPLSAGACS